MREKPQNPAPHIRVSGLITSPRHAEDQTGAKSATTLLLSDILQQLLKIPEKRKIGLVITLGYPPEDYKHRKKIRKPFNEICGFNQY